MFQHFLHVELACFLLGQPFPHPTLLLWLHRTLGSPLFCDTFHMMPSLAVRLLVPHPLEHQHFRDVVVLFISSIKPKNLYRDLKQVLVVKLINAWIKLKRYHVWSWIGGQGCPWDGGEIVLRLVCIHGGAQANLVVTQLLLSLFFLIR